MAEGTPGETAYGKIVGGEDCRVASQPKNRAVERLLRSQSPLTADVETPYLRIFKSNVYVRDLDRSLPFYVDQLGFSVLADARLEFGRWVAVAPPDGSAILAIVAPRKGTENYRLIGRHTNVSFIAEDINATYELWRGRGVRFLQPPQPQFWGGTFATFADLDNNVFELISSDEISREIEEQRRAASERTEAERRHAQELEIAKQVQARLFPQRAPALRTLDYAGVCMQARHVGGDYYDFLSFGPHRVGLLVADISGKGIAAALLMANLQANLRSQLALAGECPATFLKTVNQTFFENTVDSAYSTVFFAEYDDETRVMRYANCGHLPGLLLRADGDVEHLCPTGTVLGMFREWDGHMGECRLGAGDVLALYTDGVTEACDAAEKEFGQKGLVRALKRRRKLDAKGTVDGVLNELQKYSAGEQGDDITLIVARCTG
ncbi:MAG TPA: SpoIIE family protein phosphatase [Acidobacteriaceae bacterium]|nr:SpoIIE family protein phosphatase [Acidobacteriaceae bacterium]